MEEATRIIEELSKKLDRLNEYCIAVLHELGSERAKLKELERRMKR